VRYAGIKHSYEMAQLPEFLSGQEDGFLAFQETMALPLNTHILVDGQLQIEDFTTDMEIVFNNSNGDFIGKIPVPWAHENTGDQYDPERDANIFLSYRVEFIDDHAVKVSVRIPVDWLKKPGRSYPVTIDPSFNVNMNAGTDDGYQFTGTALDWTSEFLKVGYNSSWGMPYYFTHMTFHDVNIPRGSTIDDVILFYRVNQDWTNTCSFAWRWEDSDNSTPIANYPPYVADRDYVDSFGFSSSYSTPWSNGQWRSLQVRTGFQSIINRPGWLPGNNVSLAWVPYSNSGGYRYIYSYDGGSAPYLYVEYTESDDNYEENDTRASAYDISINERTWLSNIDGYGIQVDDDWYKIFISLGYERVLIDAQFLHNEGDIDIALYNESGALIDDSTSTDNNEYINVVVPDGGIHYYIKVYYGDAGNQYDLWWDDIQPDDSEDPLVTVTSPNGGEIWPVGSTQTITWTATDNVGVDHVDLYFGDGEFYYTIDLHVANDGSYAWLVPDSPGRHIVKVEAFDAAGNHGVDWSDILFTITEEFYNYIPLIMNN
jgi:hypothetical protein